MSKILTILLLLSLTGCGVTRHEGLIETFDPNGCPTGSYKVILGRQMMIEMTDSGRTVKADSRPVGEGMLEGIIKIITLGLIID